MTEKTVTQPLTAKRIAFLGTLADGISCIIEGGEMRALLAMASRLLELESALTFLLHARDPDFDFGDKTGAQIEIICAERLGWTPPSQSKGGV